MSGLAPEVWFPVVTLIIGAVLKAIADVWRDRVNGQRDAEARAEERRDAVRVRQDEFQRQTVLALQEAIARLGRAIGRTIVEDAKAATATGEWGNGASRDTDEAKRAARSELNMLRVRVRDPSIRELAKALSEAFTEAEFSPSEAAAMQAFWKAGQVGEQLNERIGHVLRTLEDEENRMLPK